MNRLPARAVVLSLALAPLMAAGGAFATVVPDPSAVEKLLILRQDDREIVLTRADLEGLPQHSITTHTVYHDGPQHFEGPLMRDILSHAGMSGREVTAIALNEYIADIPIEDFYRFGVIAALRQNGEVLSVRDKGPIWIVYPRDQFTELQNGDYEFRWVWQLQELDVR